MHTLAAKHQQPQCTHRRRRHPTGQEVQDPRQTGCDCSPIRALALQGQGEEWRWTRGFSGQG